MVPLRHYANLRRIIVPHPVVFAKSSEEKAPNDPQAPQPTVTKDAGGKDKDDK